MIPAPIHTSSVPSTLAEAAAAAANWERQGILARLVRIDHQVAIAEEPRRATRAAGGAARATAVIPTRRNAA
jgi:hypothetical protein